MFGRTYGIQKSFGIGSIPSLGSRYLNGLSRNSFIINIGTNYDLTGLQIEPWRECLGAPSFFYH